MTANGLDAATIEARARDEHGAAGQLVELAVEELDRLHLVLQDPSGGLVDDPPVAIGERVVRCLAAEEVETAAEAGGAGMGKGNVVPSSRLRWMGRTNPEQHHGGDAEAMQLVTTGEASRYDTALEEIWMWLETVLVAMRCGSIPPRRRCGSRPPRTRRRSKPLRRRRRSRPHRRRRRSRPTRRRRGS